MARDGLNGWAISQGPGTHRDQRTLPGDAPPALASCRDWELGPQGRVPQLLELDLPPNRNTFASLSHTSFRLSLKATLSTKPFSS